MMSEEFHPFILSLDRIILNFQYESFSQLEDVSVKCDKELLKKFKTKRITNVLKKDIDTCSICLEKFKLRNVVVNFDCKHFFHKKCINTWCSKYSVLCPLCKKDIRDMNHDST